MPNIKPRYEVHPYTDIEVDEDGKVERSYYSIDKKTHQFESKAKKEDAGYIVYFPSGSSIRIKDEEELKRQGFHLNPSLVDMDSGEDMGMSDTSLKAHSERVTHRTKPKIFEASLNTKE